jgi:hypothetical protein
MNPFGRYEADEEKHIEDSSVQVVSDVAWIGNAMFASSNEQQLISVDDSLKIQASTAAAATADDSSSSESENEGMGEGDTDTAFRTSETVAKVSAKRAPTEAPLPFPQKVRLLLSVVTYISKS